MKLDRFRQNKRVTYENGRVDDYFLNLDENKLYYKITTPPPGMEAGNFVAISNWLKEVRTGYEEYIRVEDDIFFIPPQGSNFVREEQFQNAKYMLNVNPVIRENFVIASLARYLLGAEENDIKNFAFTKNGEVVPVNCIFAPKEEIKIPSLIIKSAFERPSHFMTTKEVMEFTPFSQCPDKRIMKDILTMKKFLTFMPRWHNI
jgi:hypothetical protein